MRVPVIEGPTTQLHPLQTGPGPLLREADTSIAQAVGRAEKSVESVGRAVGEVQAQAEKQRKEADAILVSTADADYEKRATERMVGNARARPARGDVGSVSFIEDNFNAPNEGEPGFLSTNGEDAFKASGALYEALAKDRERIAKSLVTPEQRAAFEVRARARDEAIRRQVEGHVARQFEVAKAEAVERLESSALDSISLDDADEAAVAKRTAEVHDAIRGLGLADGAARVESFTKKVVATRVSSALAREDVEGAKQRLEAGRAVLGADYGKVAAPVLRAWEGRKLELEQAAAQEQVEAFVAEARDKTPEGFVNAAKARAKLRTVPPGQRKLVSHLLEERLRAEDDNRADFVKELRRKAKALYNHGGMRAIPGSMQESLNQHDPDYFGRLQDDEEAKWRRIKAERDGTKSEKAAAAKEQALQDKLTVYRYLATEGGTRARAKLDLESWDGRAGASDEAILKVKGLQEKDKEDISKGDTRGEDALVGDLEARVKDTYRDKKKRPTWTPDIMQTARAIALEERDGIRAANGGKELTEADRARAIDRALLKLKAGRTSAQEGPVPQDLPPTPPVAPDEELAPPPRPKATKPDARASALQWLQAHPDDPRAPALRKKLGLSK